MVQVAAPNGRSKHALIFAIDGCRAAALKLAVDTVKVPHFANLILFGTLTWSAYATGELDKPGITDNTFRSSIFARYSNIVEHMRKARPKDDAIFLASWPPIHEHIFQPTSEAGRCTCLRYVHSDPLVTEEKLIANTILEVSSGSPSVVFTDHGGIGKGASWTESGTALMG